MHSRAILVEDLPSLQASLTSAMKDLADVDVIAVAETADEAIAAAYACAWDVMVLDLFLREGTGLAVLSGLCPISENQRIVVLTNYATAAVRHRCHSLGAHAVFDKSNELDGFFACLIDDCGTRP